MEKELLFIGYRSFMSKSQKMCYIISFLTPPVVSKDGSSCFTNQIDVFTDEQKYNAFIKAHPIMSKVRVQFDIVGDKVHYKI